jgi:hypothetical protein
VAISEDASFDRLLARIEAREAAARRRTVLLSIVPIMIGTVVLGGMALGVRTLAERTTQLKAEAESYRQETEQRRQEAESARAQAAELQRRVNSLEEQLRQTTDLTRFRHPIDLTDFKMIASLQPRAARALDIIFLLREQNVRWRLGGRSPSEGFDSPSFAAYVIERARPGLLGPLAATDPVAASRALMNVLPRTTTPQPGDLVFYPSGYALFRFNDRQNRPFVIGMTPQGILALDPGFSQSVGAARVNW